MKDLTKMTKAELLEEIHEMKQIMGEQRAVVQADNRHMDEYAAEIAGLESQLEYAVQCRKGVEASIRLWQQDVEDRDATIVELAMQLTGNGKDR